MAWNKYPAARVSGLSLVLASISCDVDGIIVVVGVSGFPASLARLSCRFTNSCGERSEFSRRLRLAIPTPTSIFATPKTLGWVCGGEYAQTLIMLVLDGVGHGVFCFFMGRVFFGVPIFFIFLPKK